MSPRLLQAAAVLLLDGGAPTGLVAGCIVFFTLRVVCPLIEKKTDFTSQMREKFLNDAVKKQYVGEVIHYVEDGSDHIARVVRTIEGEEGVLLVLNKEDHKIPIEQIQAVGSGSDYFGKPEFGYYQRVFFETAAAHPLNDLAARLTDEGHGVVEGTANHFFDNGKISVEVDHNFSDERIFSTAQFLIDRDEILPTIGRDSILPTND